MTEAEKRRRVSPQGGEFLFHERPDGTVLRYAIWHGKTVSKRGSMIVLPGASEFIEKYYEVVNELLERDFSVIVLDWRGQGLSSRPLNNPQKHHYDSFDSLVCDLDSFVAMLATTDLPKPFNILAHSMGGHIALRYMHDHPHTISNAILTAPMVDVHYAGIPVVVVKGLIGLMGMMGKLTNYAVDQGDFDREAGGNYKMELLTSDPERFEDEFYQISQNKSLVIGGKTYGWLRAAMASIEILNAKGYGEAITTPLTIIQASEDGLVRNDRQKALAMRIPSAKFIVVEGSKHEILKEQDCYRDEFWAIFDQTFASGQ
jgi:lysophospholipase